MRQYKKMIPRNSGNNTDWESMVLKSSYRLPKEELSALAHLEDDSEND